MLGLIIKNDIYWHPQWSSEIGRTLSIKDSTLGLFVFDPSLTHEQILEHLQDIPSDLYSLVELQEAPEDACDYMADSGQCYSRVLH